jgi:hypothetical protein
MRYPELTNLCKNCTGCNLLEIPFFTGKKECENYSKSNETGLEKCWKILRGEQMRYEQISQQKNTN